MLEKEPDVENSHFFSGADCANALEQTIKTTRTKKAVFFILPPMKK